MAASRTALSSTSPVVALASLIRPSIWAVGAFRLLTELCEDLVETLDLVLRIDHVRLEAGVQVGICREFRHVWNGFRELLLRVVDVLQDAGTDLPSF